MKNRNKALIYTSLAFGLIGLLAFIIGGYLAGWDFAGWFTSKEAMWVYLIAGLYVLAIIFIFLKDKITRL